MSDKKPLYVDWWPEDALKGMDILEPMEELAYRRILDLIYATNDQLMDDPKRMMRMTKTGKKWTAIRKTLIELGKIYVENGFIKNEKCTKHLIAARTRIEQNALAGKISAEKRKALKENDTGSTDVELPLNAPKKDQVGASETKNEQFCYEQLEQSHSEDNSINSLKNNNTASTGVGTSVSTSVPTIYHLSPIKEKDKHPPPVTVPTTEPGGGGGDFHSENLGGGIGTFRIEPHLSDADRERARAIAPGLDLHPLFQTYDEGISSGKRSIPTYPARAFLAWLTLYLGAKAKSPSPLPAPAPKPAPPAKDLPPMQAWHSSPVWIQLEQAEYQTWIRPLTLENGAIFSPSKFHQARVQERYGHLFERAVGEDGLRFETRKGTE